MTAWEWVLVVSLVANAGFILALGWITYDKRKR